MKAASIGVVLGTLLTASAALAFGHMGTSFNKTYSIAPESELGKARCNVCHVPGAKKSKLNPYGVELHKALASLGTSEVTPEVLKVIEKKDSDADGVANKEEIAAGTLPGDPQSVPVSKPKEGAPADPAKPKESAPSEPAQPKDAKPAETPKAEQATP